MKAFLSHSSQDKSFVEKVAKLLRPGTYELDSLTFEKGELSVDQIINSLKRSDLFCLFMSDASALSQFVEFEQRLALELIGAGKIKSFLTLCLDESSFQKLSSNIKFFNAVRYVQSPEAAAHIINGKLISAKISSQEAGHPFIGRESELKDLETQVLDFTRPKIKSIFLSGNTGVGRKSILEIFLSKQYPHIIQSYPKFEVEPYAGFDEIFRQITATINPSLGIKSYVEAAIKFSEKTSDEKADVIAQMLNGLLTENLVCVAIDAGGLLHASGALTPEMENIIDRLNDHPHPPLAIISPRMTPRNVRRSANDIAYVAVGALTRDDAGRLIAWTMRSADMAPTPDQMNQLIELSDYHPFNIYEMRERIKAVGISAFIGDAGSFLAWKHKETSEYIRSIPIDETDSRILSILLLAPELDFGAIVNSLQETAENVSKSIQSLVDIHVLRYSDDRFSISPPLRIAVERDPRVKMSAATRSEVIRRLAYSLTISLGDETAPIALADAAILASLESGETLHAVASALLLPSHRIWLAQRHYDTARWTDCIRLAQDAVKDKSRLSVQGYIAGCRLLCLSAARENQQSIFNDGIAKLRSVARDNWAKSNVEFLIGFNFRIRGRILDAERHFKDSYALNGNDRATARELASVCLATGNNAGAEKFARKAYELAPNTPYTIDILVGALIKTLGAKCLKSQEVGDLLDRLKILDDEEGKSFSHTRNAEIELLYGDARKAEIYIKEAISRTPHLFEPKLLRAKIYFRQERMSLLKDELTHLERATSKFGQSENRAHRREVLLLKSDYLVETGQFSIARDVFNDDSCFSDQDRAIQLKKINIAEGFNSAK